MPNNPQALTIRSTGIAKVITTELAVFVPNNKNGITVNGIWDTGATGTAITSFLVKQLGLVPTGKTTVNTANGSAIQNIYTIEIGLPNKFLVKGITATEIPNLPTNNEVLIGMDIITLGDFSVTHYKGKSCMSFRMPSLHEIDYVKNLKL